MTAYEPYDPEPQLPDELRDALRRADFAGAGPTPEVDAAIGAAARRHFRGPRRLLLRLGVPLAAAASLALLITVYMTTRRAPMSPHRQLLQKQVTILDAFALARQLKSGAVPDARWDRSGDGVVDARDVDALARAAVRLEDKS